MSGTNGSRLGQSGRWQRCWAGLYVEVTMSGKVGQDSSNMGVARNVGLKLRRDYGERDR